MKFAAIDVGSNAVRLLIQESVETEDNGPYFRKISLTRVPIRLGEDVFSDGVIGDKKARQLVKAMKAFRLLMEVNEVEVFRAVATSAMREADNGDEVNDQILNQAKFRLEIISGKEEAQLIFDNFHTAKLDAKQTYLYVDVGGGSTEVTLIKKNKRQKSESFKLGSVRLLNDKVKEEHWQDMKAWVKKLVKGEDDVIIIATGGNINRIYKESKASFGEMMELSELKKILEKIESFSIEDRIRKLKLKPDRADVIVPAGKIYRAVAKAAGAKELMVPKVGLSDGIVYNLYLQSFENE